MYSMLVDYLKPACRQSIVLFLKKERAYFINLELISYFIQFKNLPKSAMRYALVFKMHT